MTSEVLCDKVIGTKVAHDGSSINDDDENNFVGEDDDNYNDIGVRVCCVTKRNYGGKEKECNAVAGQSTS